MWEKGEDKDSITGRAGDSAKASKLEQCECSQGRSTGQGQSGHWESALNVTIKNLVFIFRLKAFKWLRNIMMFVESQLGEGSELVKRLIVI